MFKKHLSDIKTSAPLRGSDRKKLNTRIKNDFVLFQELPEKVFSQKFISHANEKGVLYSSQDGNPIWFSVEDSIIPSIYTLWEYQNIIPSLSTPKAVIPVLFGGADLMVPGVIHHPKDLKIDQLVSIHQYEPNSKSGMGPPLAVGRMVVDSSALEGDGAKGKAVRVIHTYKDKLWEMGVKSDPPEPEGKDNSATPPPSSEGIVDEQVQEEEIPKSTSESTTTIISPEEISSILYTSLVQSLSLSGSLHSFPPSTFPILSTTFYTSHILPSRPAFIPSIHRDNSSNTITHTHTPIDIKHSTHKSLTAFLRSCEKNNLLTLKEPKGKNKNGSNNETSITSINTSHPDVLAHVSYKTVGEEDEKRVRREKREREQKESGGGGGKSGEVVVVEFWKPHSKSVRFFERLELEGTPTNKLYTYQDIKSLFIEFVTKNNLVNPHKQAYINVKDSEELSDLFAAPASGSGSGSRSTPSQEFVKREDAIQMILERMQRWYKVEAEGKETILKKGTLKPLSIVVKLRQGRKACTLITGFETYFLDADVLAEELRRICASATSVSNLVGGQKGEQEVMVQGKQIKAVIELVCGKFGVPKKWVEAVDLTEKKK